MKTLKNKLLVVLVSSFAIALSSTNVLNLHVQEKNIDVNNVQLLLPKVNLKVKNANEGNEGNFQVALTDGIVVKYYVSLDESVTSATASFESTTEVLNTKVDGKKSEGKWEFIFEKVTPQYIDANFSIKINNDFKVTDYSVSSYLNQIINGEYVEQYKNVAKDLIYYGQAAKFYKFNTAVTATPSKDNEIKDKMSLTTKFADETQIYSATVVFDTLPAIQFGFKIASTTASVFVENEDVTSKLVKNQELYTYTLKNIYALDFSKQYTIELKDGSNTQTLKYSINDYAARMQNSKKEAMKTLAKALYYYGESAKALKEYQASDFIIKEPTYTETGIAKINGKEVVLPILNAYNYNYSQIAKDGSEYKYNNNKDGTATFTHKTYSNIKIKKEITADTLTFNYHDYNNVTIHWEIASLNQNKIQGTYQDGTYILTINDTVEVPNISTLNKALPSVKINGKGTLKVTNHESSLNALTIENAKFDISTKGLNVNTLTLKGKDASLTTKSTAMKNLVVDEANYVVNNGLSLENINVINKGTLNVNGTVSVTNLFLDNESTLIVTGTTGDAISVKNEGKLQLFGTANIKAVKGTTGICFVSEKSTLHLSNTSRVTITGGDFTIGHFASKENAKVYYPKNAISENNKITSSEGNILLSYGAICKVEFVQENN